jgi:hypothetical protein
LQTRKRRIGERYLRIGRVEEDDDVLLARGRVYF